MGTPGSPPGRGRIWNTQPHELLHGVARPRTATARATAAQRVQNDLSIIVIADSARDHALAAVGGNGSSRPGRVRSVWSLRGAFEEIDARAVDAVVLDDDLPLSAWLRVQGRLRERYPDLPLLVISRHTDSSHVLLAIAAGASGYLARGSSPESVLEAVRELKSGGAPMSPEVASQVIRALRRHAPLQPPGGLLSDREQLLLQLLCDGHSYKTAAAELGVAMDTVRFHIRNIYQKLHVHSKAEAVSKALRSGLVS